MYGFKSVSHKTSYYATMANNRTWIEESWVALAQFRCLEQRVIHPPGTSAGALKGTFIMLKTGTTACAPLIRPLSLPTA